MPTDVVWAGYWFHVWIPSTCIIVKSKFHRMQYNVVCCLLFFMFKDRIEPIENSNLFQKFVFESYISE